MFLRDRKLTHKLSWLIYAYLLGLACWFGLWLTVADGQWLLVLVNRFVPYLFYPLAIFAPLAVGLRLRNPSALLLCAVLLFTFFYAPYILPKPASEKDASFWVMTYNVLLVNESYGEVAEVILSQQPDLVALQEVQPRMMDQLQTRLAADYPFSVMGWEHEFGTTAIFSQHPIHEQFVLDLENDRPAVVVRTEIDQLPITFISAHLNAYGLKWIEPINRPEVIQVRTKTQNRQAEILLDFIKNEVGTVVVGCDCNSFETSESMRMLSAVLGNSAREVGWRPRGSRPVGTQPDDGLWRIDYVLFLGDLDPIGAYLLNDTGGSDHQPVLASFAKSDLTLRPRLNPQDH